MLAVLIFCAFAQATEGIVENARQAGNTASVNCKQLFAPCSRNDDCCTNLCAVSGQCVGKLQSEKCRSNNVCLNDMCELNKCKCLEIGESCQKNENCCDFDSQDVACAGDKCLKTAEALCRNSNQCLSGKCVRRQCTCHKIGEFCYESKQCCNKNCEESKCQMPPCIGSGKNCPKDGKCCNASETCKPLSPGGIPNCGKCKVNNERCDDDKECCQLNCKYAGGAETYRICACSSKFSKCRTDTDCCNYAECLLKNGRKQCEYTPRKNNEDCQVNDQCVSKNCSNGKCKCIESGKLCNPKDNQCCFGFCDRANDHDSSAACSS